MSDILEEIKEHAEITGISETDAPLPVLEYTEVSESAPEAVSTAKSAAPPVAPPQPYIPPRKRKRVKGIAAIIALSVFAGLGFAGYRFGAFDVISGLDGFSMENITTAPEGAGLPSFIPIDPLEYLNATGDELVTVPDETGLELPSADGEKPAESPIPQNHYTQTPNVSEFYTRAAQDESYVYFMEYTASEERLSDIMRTRISTGRTEPVSNANEVGGSIYSFALFGQNIITCELNRKTGGYAFYRVPKSGEDAQFLFEEASPAIINVYDNKLFMLFTESQRLGVFDPVSDTRPAYIALEPTGEDAGYMPEFSVLNGYLYYGISYRDSIRAKYFRRSLYTGAVTELLDSGEAGDVQIVNPCWDGEGKAYYGIYEPGTNMYSLAAGGDGGSPQTLNTFDFKGVISPLIAPGDEFLLAAASNEDLCKYKLDDFLVELEASAQGSPFAITKDYLITSDGIYRIFDFEFIPF